VYTMERVVTANTVVLMSAPVVLTTYNVPTGTLITSTFVYCRPTVVNGGLCFVLFSITIYIQHNTAQTWKDATMLASSYIIAIISFEGSRDTAQLINTGVD